MTITVETPSKSTFSKKEVRHQIAVKLETALADLKSGMGEKKFKSRIKKASKLFSDHFAPSPSKKSAKPKSVKSLVRPAKAAKPGKAAKPAPVSAPAKKTVKKAAPAGKSE